MRSHVYFDTVHSDKLCLLIEYAMSTGLHCFRGYQGSHIAFPFNLLALGPWSETDDTESWDRWGHLFSMFWHVHTGACPHPCMLALVFVHVRRHSILPSDVMGIRVWVSPTFSSVSSYNRVLLGADLGSDSRYSLTQQGCHTGAYLIH